GYHVTSPFTKVLDGLCIPWRVANNGPEVTLRPTGERQVYQASGPISTIEVNRNFYVLSEAVKF
ncbi:MAG: hypothetical protein ACK55S_13280, partial [Planctomycetota bacterium]